MTSIMTVKSEEIPVRFMVETDIKDVMDILFLNDNEMTKKELIQTLRKDTCRCSYEGTMGKAIGVMGYHMKGRHIYIVLLYAHTDYPIEDTLKPLLQRLKDKFPTRAASIISFWVPAKDLHIQLFLKSNGFVAKEVNDDEYLMEYKE